MVRFRARLAAGSAGPTISRAGVPPSARFAAKGAEATPVFPKKKRSPAVRRRGGSRTEGSRCDNYAFDAVPRRKQATLGATKGRATGAGSNCLVHALLSHAEGAPSSAGNEKDPAKTRSAARRAPGAGIQSQDSEIGAARPPRMAGANFESAWSRAARRLHFAPQVNGWGRTGRRPWVRRRLQLLGARGV